MLTSDEEGFKSNSGDVQIFLKELNEIFNSEHYEFDLPTREDKEEKFTTIYCLNQLSFSDKSQVVEVLKTLKVSDYFKTVKDKNIKKYNEYFYIFGKIIQERMVYIKIKIVSREKKKVLCISFHFPEFEMKVFPYK